MPDLTVSGTAPYASKAFTDWVVWFANLLVGKSTAVLWSLSKLSGLTTMLVITPVPVIVLPAFTWPSLVVPSA